MWKQKRKGKEKKRNKNIVKVNLCVYLFYEFFIIIMIKLQRIKKNLIFGFSHGLELLTYMEDVFLISDEKIIIKTSLTCQSHEAAYLR